jgi:hypothetical protein
MGALSYDVLKAKAERLMAGEKWSYSEELPRGSSSPCYG